ncbi:hypothetical protein, unknown function [Leishmania braziliensis MHOM/BR/75/M2904]|uniref:Uncharacterized protein n=2 Tax=Leishmania braziliensis TaxID=5660 RepID=A4H6S7_LEIBR|nr:hypothetical protein, unknown function [Leishmania braziliensis MHOM/BR/75/M2904]CAJ2468348.1 unnamed protein product [Leishmania braziliensis]CAM37387.1 hypothetical protein, unknown function [Leishmania braziliensis MHOM/BR/75/M2904]
MCSKAIKRLLEEAEMAVHRCRLLEEMLNEQAMQGEKLRTDLHEQQEENKLLTHEKESLKATIARMEIEAEVAAAAAAAARTVNPVTPGHTPASTPSKANAEVHVNASASAESVAAVEEMLSKKKRQLDVREATLKDALKKVSADAAKVADQRAALQEQEKRMTAQLTAQLTSLFEEERQRLEDICADAVTDMQNTYREWIAQQRDAAVERRRKYEHVMETRLQRATSEVAEMRAERDVLQQTLENLRAQLAELQENASRVQTERRSETKDGGPSSQYAREEKESLQEAVAEGIPRAGAANERPRATQTDPDFTELLGGGEQPKHADAAAAYAALQRRAQDSIAALMRDMRAKEVEWERAKAAAVATAESAARLAERERLGQEAEKIRQESQREIKEAMRIVTQQRDSAMDALRTQHQRDKEEWLSRMRRLEEGQQNQEEAWRAEKAALQKKCSELETHLEGRKAAAGKLQQQLRDAKRELSELKAKARDNEDAVAEERRKRANATAKTVQYSASSLLKEAQQGQQRILAAHAGALALLQEKMQKLAQVNCAAANSRDERRREVTQRLHTELECTRQERDTALEQLGKMQEAAEGMKARMNEESAQLGALRDVIQRQQRDLARLQEQHQRTVDELRAARAAVSAPSAADAAASLAESENPVMRATDDTCYRVLLRLEQRWVLQQADLQCCYSVALYAVVQRTWTQMIGRMTSSLVAEAERQRRSRDRSAEALENTTSTIKEVQRDLRLRMQALLQQQVDVEEREKRLQDKKKRMDVVCRSLHTVAQELRKKHLDATENPTLEEVMKSARVMSESP